MQGGLGLFSAKEWNNAAAIKLLWLIHQKKDLLWVKWVHGHYLQHSNIWQVQHRSNDSWMWKQLLKVRNMLLAKFGNTEVLMSSMDSCCVNGKISMSAIYNALYQSNTSAVWAETTWGRLNYPKHSFILWLVNHSRHLTQERLCRLRLLDANLCVLCSSQPENCKHLFFECHYSAAVWNMLMDWLRFTWRTCNWCLLIHWYSHNLRGKNFKKNMKRMALAAAVYSIWQERNYRIFQAKARGPADLFRAIKYSIYSKLLNEDIPVHMKDELVKL
ncbi:uncharacterized protein LOC109827093 [Asparagus officinalis]|uniref:uncharacterized protein LOC109827093 n=1 Tax=Asparagus officinalis TaxID=4686 RepID=UPI00098DEEE2|nr:uncharacterized protein LOC109827093 [Asparagus officinalis]